MQIKNTVTRYGIVAKLFHWIMAIIILGMLALGLYMVDLPVSLTKLKLYGLHKEFGILILMLVILRLVWRINNITPNLPENTPLWQKLAANGVHWAFYVFMIIMPITGWMISSAAGLRVSFFGLFVLPNIVSTSKPLQLLMAEIHEYLAYGLIVVICLHIGAALQHHFLYKDTILRRMTW